MPPSLTPACRQAGVREGEGKLSTLPASGKEKLPIDFMKLFKYPILPALVLAVTAGGCATAFKTSPTYPQAIKEIRTIAVMPPDVDVYKVTAGGVVEKVDEWSAEAKGYIREALKTHLSQRHDFEIKFIEEDWLKANHKTLWQANRELYYAVSLSALYHAYDGVAQFPTKRKSFEYTLGKEVKELADAAGADALFFIYGLDHEDTAGRTAIKIFAALLTNTIIYSPSMMTMGLVNAKNGDLEWFVVSPAQTEYSFRSQKHINTLVEWETRHFTKTDKKK